MFTAVGRFRDAGPRKQQLRSVQGTGERLGEVETSLTRKMVLQKCGMVILDDDDDDDDDVGDLRLAHGFAIGGSKQPALYLGKSCMLLKTSLIIPDPYSI